MDIPIADPSRRERRRKKKSVEVRPALTLSIVHRRNGVAKTTTCWNTAHELCRLGKRVLVVDADSQSELTRLAGFHDYHLEHGLGSVLLGELPIGRAIRRATVQLSAHRAAVPDHPVSEAETPHPPSAVLDILPASHRLEDEVLPELIRCEARPDLLRWTLSSVRHDYDFVLIDGPQGMSLLTQSVLAAADIAIIPVATGLGEFAEVELLDILSESLRVRSDLASDRLWVLPTRYKRRSIRHQRTLRRLREHLPTQAKLLGPVHHSQWVETATQNGQPIREIHKGLEATESYRQLALALSGMSEPPLDDERGLELDYWRLR